MNIQDILRRGGTKFDAVLDYSEFYDFELVENVLGKVDVVLDYSEFYDYTLGDNTVDYIYYESVVGVTGKFLVTEDNYILITQDNYMIEYQ